MIIPRHGRELETFFLLRRSYAIFNSFIFNMTQALSHFLKEIYEEKQGPFFPMAIPTTRRKQLVWNHFSFLYIPVLFLFPKFYSVIFISCTPPPPFKKPKEKLLYIFYFPPSSLVKQFLLCYYITVDKGTWTIVFDSRNSSSSGEVVTTSKFRSTRDFRTKSWACSSGEWRKTVLFTIRIEYKNKNTRGGKRWGKRQEWENKTK